jgi:hypothetical protein
VRNIAIFSEEDISAISLNKFRHVGMPVERWLPQRLKIARDEQTTSSDTISKKWLPGKNRTFS